MSSCFFKFHSNLMLSYASAKSCMRNILVKFSVVAEFQSFKGHSSAGQKLNIKSTL